MKYLIAICFAINIAFALNANNIHESMYVSQDSTVSKKAHKPLIVKTLEFKKDFPSDARDYKYPNEGEISAYSSAIRDGLHQANFEIIKLLPNEKLESFLNAKNNPVFYSVTVLPENGKIVKTTFQFTQKAADALSDDEINLMKDIILNTELKPDRSLTGKYTTFINSISRKQIREYLESEGVLIPEARESCCKQDSILPTQSKENPFASPIEFCNGCPTKIDASQYVDAEERSEYIKNHRDDLLQINEQILGFIPKEKLNSFLNHKFGDIIYHLTILPESGKIIKVRFILAKNVKESLSEDELNKLKDIIFNYQLPPETTLSGKYLKYNKSISLKQIREYLER